MSNALILGFLDGGHGIYVTIDVNFRNPRFALELENVFFRKELSHYLVILPAGDVKGRSLNTPEIQGKPR
jgi:hypothetical protein